MLVIFTDDNDDAWACPDNGTGDVLICNLMTDEECRSVKCGPGFKRSREVMSLGEFDARMKHEPEFKSRVKEFYVQ